jgi:uncharacterized protein (TIGR02145 family)
LWIVAECIFAFFSFYIFYTLVTSDADGAGDTLQYRLEISSESIDLEGRDSLKNLGGLDSNGSYEYRVVVRDLYGDSAVATGTLFAPPLSPCSELGAKVFTDSRDGQKYACVIIGTQTWMAENLNYYAGSGSYCYDDETANCNTYGRLYIWDVAMGSATSSSTNPSGVQGVCPAGWHLPSDEEWEELAKFVATETGLTYKDGDHWTQIGSKLKTTIGWTDDENETDEYGFSGLPGGRRDVTGYYNYVGLNALWWSSTESSISNAYYRDLYFDNDIFYRRYYSKSSARSVRCIMD